MIDRQTIEYIREKADIVEIISEYVALRKRGKNYIGLCPFHGEKTPSFTVSSEKNIFHCFGCGEGGEIFSFIQKIEKISFPEAVLHLGRKYGIEIKDPGGKPPVSVSGQERFYRILELASKFFEQMLLSSKLGEGARDYVQARKINPETVRVLGLGFSPAGPDALMQNLISRGIAPEDMEKAGLAIKRESDGKYYDRFRSRLMFPIRDLRGRIVAFGGRALKDDEAKYINSPESEIYSKGNYLYGFDLSAEEVKKKGFLILVEGYMDFLSPYQAGVKNIAATLGTALTLPQAKLIARFTKRVVFAYDTDSAGSAATERGILILRQHGIEVFAAKFLAKDPDEMLKTQGVAPFDKVINEALPWFKFKIERIVARSDLTHAEGRAALMHEIAGFLAVIPDRLLRNEYAREIAQKYNLDPQLMLGEAAQVGYWGSAHSPQTKSHRRFTEKPAHKILSAERNVIRLALEDKECYEILKGKKGEIEFVTPESRALLQLILARSEYSKDLPGQILLSTEDKELKKALSEILLSEDEILNKKQTLIDSLNTILGYHLRQRVHGLRLAIKTAESNQEFAKLSALSQEFCDCSNQIRTMEQMGV